MFPDGTSLVVYENDQYFVYASDGKLMSRQELNVPTELKNTETTGVCHRGVFRTDFGKNSVYLLTRDGECIQASVVLTTDFYTCHWAMLTMLFLKPFLKHSFLTHRSCLKLCLTPFSALCAAISCSRFVWPETWVPRCRSCSTDSPSSGRLSANTQWSITWMRGSS